MSKWEYQDPLVILIDSENWQELIECKKCCYFINSDNKTCRKNIGWSEKIDWSEKTDWHCLEFKNKYGG